MLSAVVDGAEQFRAHGGFSNKIAYRLNRHSCVSPFVVCPVLWVRVLGGCAGLYLGAGADKTSDETGGWRDKVEADQRKREDWVWVGCVC